MKKIFIMSILTMLSSLSSCQAQNKGYKSLSADDYEKAIADTAVIRLDVRTAEEFANGHIRGAINIDVLKSDFEQKAAATLPKSKTIAVNCRSLRSGRARWWRWRGASDDECPCAGRGRLLYL